MTMKSFREQQRAAQLAYVQQLIAEAGSVRQAAKRADMRRPNFIRLRNTLSHGRDKLTTAAPKATG